MKKYEKILLLSIHALGDTIMFLPTIKSISHHFSNTDIIILVKNSSVKEMLELANLPGNVSIISFNKSSPTRFRLAPFNFSVLYKVVRLRPDIIVAMTKLNKYFTPILLKVSRGRVTIGEEHGFGKYLLTNPIKTDLKLHRVLRNMCLLKPLNISQPDKPDLNLYPSRSSLIKVSSLIKTHLSEPPKICFAVTPSVTVGQRWRLWPSKYWAELILLLLKRFDAACFVLGGTSKWDKEIGDEIFMNLPNDAKAYNLIGKLSIKDTIAFISLADFVCGVDNGLLHIAASVKTFIHAIWSVTQIQHYPFTEDLLIISADCQCNENYPKSLRRECRKQPRCLSQLSPRTVYEKIEEVWASRPTKAKHKNIKINSFDRRNNKIYFQALEAALLNKTT